MTSGQAGTTLDVHWVPTLATGTSHVAMVTAPRACFIEGTSEAVFTLGDTRSFFLTSASKFNVGPDGGIFDVSPKNARASPDVKTT